MTWSTDWSGQLPAPQPPTTAAAWEPGDLAVLRPVAVEQGSAVELVPEGPDWQAELESAYRQGYDDGCVAGAETERKRLASAHQTLAAAATAAAAQTTPADLLHEHVLALSLAVARHVIGRDVHGDPHVIADVVRRALMQFPVDESLRIRVNPQDLSTISTVSTSDGGPIRIAPGRNVEWIPDATIEGGDCIVEGQQRIVDGRLDRALERIYRRLSDDG